MMGSALLYNRVILVGDGSSGFPDYVFDGNVTVLDTGEESGVWKVALTSTGTLVLNTNAKNVTVQMQGGGGGGGAGSASGSGSDGEDGSIETYIGDLAAGEYSVVIGAAGKAGSNSAGGKGGNTTFGDLLTAEGGAGGAYNGGSPAEHACLHGNYGRGGERGYASSYTGSVTKRYYIQGAYAIYSAADPDSTITGYMTSGTKYYVSQTTKKGTDGKSWWVLDNGGYVPWASTSNCWDEIAADYRSWYGFAGNPGIVLISGEV